MKRNLLVTVGLAAVLALGLTARLQIKEAEYTAHEWVTFTSIQGSDGEPIRWNPFVTSDLPGFVFDRTRPTHHDELLRSNGQEFKMLESKQSRDFLQRMETPVIYFGEDRVTDPVKRRQHLGVIQAEASRLHRLIGNVLDFARRDHGGFRSPRETVDLCAVTRQVLDSFAPQFSAEGLRVDTELPSEPVHVSGDGDALAQVVNNLLSNAVKYAAAGGEVTLQLIRGSGRVELQVLDRGPGIPKEFSEQVFEEFFRADDALASGVTGAGLGLTLARRIARDHGGDVTFNPREGGGSVFRFTLPLLQDVARKPE